MSYENFAKLITYFRKLQEADLFPIVAVTGPLGQGKSSFSIQASKWYCKTYLNEEYFSFRKYMAYDNEDVLKKYYNLDEFSPLIADEAARFAMSEDWNKAINKEVKKATAQLRPRHLLFFMNIPQFTWLDRKYIDELVSLWAWIPTRGYVFIFRPDNNLGIRDRWHLKDFGKFRYRIDQFTDVERIFNLVSNHKCFFDVFKFPPVPQDIYAEYLNLREKKTFLQASEQFVEQRDIAKIMAYNLKYKWAAFLEAVKSQKQGGVNPTYRTIAKQLLKDPIKKRQMVGYVTLHKWVNEVAGKIPEQVILDKIPEEEAII